MNIRTIELFIRLKEMGFSLDEAQQLRRIEMTLHRWFELECGNSDNYKSWAIERDEETQKPFMVTHPHQGKTYRTAIADREAGARKRLDKIMESHPDYVSYIQGDPRGVSLYIIRKTDVEGQDINSVYYRGICVAA